MPPETRVGGEAITPLPHLKSSQEQGHDPAPPITARVAWGHEPHSLCLSFHIYEVGIMIQCKDCDEEWASWVAQLVKNQPAMQETWVQSPGGEDPLEEDMATHSSIDESVPRQGIKDSGIVCVSLKFATVISVIQVHSTTSHNRTDTLSLLGVKIAVFPSAMWKGLRCVAWALGCR